MDGFRCVWTFLLVFLIGFRALIPFVHYVVNIDYIQEELCVNSDNPAMKCYGKCYLAKDLDQVNAHQHSSSESVQVLKVLDVFTETLPLSMEVIFKHPNRSNAPTIPWLCTYAYTFFTNVLKPPIV